MADKDTTDNPNIDTDGSGRGVITEEANGLKAPKNVIATPSSARTIYEIYRRNSLERILLYSQIEGIISGNPPYDPEDLLRNGLGHVSNFNNLDARALFDKAALAYWNLLYESDTFLTIKIGDSPDEVEISQILTEEFDRAIKKWPNLKTVVNTLIAQIVKFGVSVAFWRDERDWRWDVVELSRFFVSNEASTNTDRLNTVIIESVFTGQFLFEAYEWAKEKTYRKGSSATPWSVNELEQLLLRYANGNQTNGGMYRDFMDLQRAYQDGSLCWEDVFKDGIRLISVFSAEYDGKISHYMLDRYQDSGEFLYFVDRQYDSIEEALVIFTASPGEFTIHSNRGVGHKIFAGSQAIMQIDCAIVDMAKFTSTPFLKTLAVGAKDFEQIRVYPGTPTHIGTADFVQTNFGDNLSQLIGASQYLQGKMSFNAANSGDDPSVPDSSQGSISNTEARFKSYKEFNVLKNSIQHFYSSADFVAENMVSKMIRCKKGYPGYAYHEEFKRRCLKRGVPSEVFDISDSDLSPITRNLPIDWEVKASRVAGDGSTVGTIMGLEAMAPMLGAFGPNEALFYRKMYIKALFGQEYVQSLTQDSGQPDDTAAGASLAQVENGMMMQGQQPLVEATNTHASHIAVHFAFANNIISQVKQQQLSPIDADKQFTVLIPHLGEHIQIFGQSPFSASKMPPILKAWKDIRTYADFNRKNADAMLQAQLKQREQDAEKTQQVMTDAQRKDFIAQTDAQRKDFTVAATVERADRANQVRGDVAKKKAHDDAENERLAIRLKNQAKKQAESEGPQFEGTESNLAPDTELDRESTENIRAEISRLNGAEPARDDFENI